MQHVNASAGWLMNFKNDTTLRNLCAVSTAENKFFPWGHTFLIISEIYLSMKFAKHYQIYDADVSLGHNGKT